MAAKIRINQTDNRSSPRSVSGKTNTCLSYDIITIGDGEMKKVDWGCMDERKREEECKIFTIAGLHKETINTGGEPHERRKSTPDVK